MKRKYNIHQIMCVFLYEFWQGQVGAVQTFDPSTPEAEAGKSLSPSQPGLHREMLSQRPNLKKKKLKNRVLSMTEAIVGHSATVWGRMLA